MGSSGEIMGCMVMNGCKNLTLVEITKSFLFHPNFLIACPITRSDSPSEYPSAQSKKLIPLS